jgi:hypothetical protein
MRDLILLLATTFAYTVSAKKSKKRYYSNSSATAARYPPSAFCNTAQTQSGDLMYMSECKENDVTYGVISIRLKKAYNNLDDAEMVLNRFMNNLQPGFGIQHTTRGGIYQTANEKVKSIIDYWQDIEQLDWKVKGWTDGRNISVLYVKNIGQLQVAQEENFLNAFIFIAA